MMACLCFLGPEFIFQLALGQWESARRSVKTFKKSGYQRWTLKHAFFADMGGFILHSDDWVSFPVNSKQLHYFVTEGYIPFSAVNLDSETIEDKKQGRYVRSMHRHYSDIMVYGQLFHSMAPTACIHNIGTYNTGIHSLYTWHIFLLGFET
jgi:hypothetical protein